MEYIHNNQHTHEEKDNYVKYSDIKKNRRVSAKIDFFFDFSQKNF